MTKTSVNFCIDSDLLAELRIYATQTGCSVPDLIEQFCQQGLRIAAEDSVPELNAYINRHKNKLLTERIEIVETDVKSILKRLSVLESKVDVDIDVNDYLQSWQKSLELKIASLVEKLVEERLGVARRPAGIEHAHHVAPVSDTEPALISTKSKELLDNYQTDPDYDDEPDEILTDFLES